MRTVWHDLECGSYHEDVPLWRELAARHGAPVLDVGAGTGRVTLDLARQGFAVTAVDIDADLLRTLRERAAGLDVSTVTADARALSLGRRFPLCIVPMQTIQLLGGPDGRAAFLAGVRDHLTPEGVMAIALADELELFEVGENELGPLPDLSEIDGIVYSSRATAVRVNADRTGYLLERRREIVTLAGELDVELDLIQLDQLDAATLETEAAAVGLRPHGRISIPATEAYVGSTVVMLGA